MASRRLSLTTPLLTRPLQIYHSPSTNPYLNLSIEHHLLQHTHPNSTILFLYANAPCVVIGRNQNPWLETNLLKLRSSQIHLVRRRSGGGTVFHDEGNMNWSVICPPAVFDRDRHAEMVTRALRRLGVDGVRVNERHDIVMDCEGGEKTYKVSGSAYKLTRTRSLHHGTCLLSSGNLGMVSGLLRSPAEGFIKARGVESVRSPIRNVGVGNEEFADAVVREFQGMYGGVDGGIVDEEEASEVEGVRKGVEELESVDWIYGQTPQFTFSTHPTEEDPRLRPKLDILPPDFNIQLTIRHGEIQDSSITGTGLPASHLTRQHLVKQQIYRISDWGLTLSQAGLNMPGIQGIGSWLNAMFGLSPGLDGLELRQN